MPSRKFCVSRSPLPSLDVPVSSRASYLLLPTRAMSYFDQPRRASQRRNQENQAFKSPRLNRPMPQRGAVTPTEAVARGYVKWYNPEKGFGFVALEDGTDVFLHGSVLARGGFSINPGDTVRVGVGQGVKGRQVTETGSQGHCQSGRTSHIHCRECPRRGEVVERTERLWLRCARRGHEGHLCARFHSS